MIAAVQAGGRSSRMGLDKAWISIDGRPMIEQVLTVAEKSAQKLALVIHRAAPKRAEYERLVQQWKADLLLDLYDYSGPLGGIETVLKAYPEAEAIMVLACDLPYLTVEFLQFLQGIHRDEKNLLTVPRDAAGRPQMLAAIYAKGCLPAISTMLAEHELKARLLPERVPTRWVNYAEYAHLPQAERLLLNLNTPRDLTDV